MKEEKSYDEQPEHDEHENKLDQPISDLIEVQKDNSPHEFISDSNINIQSKYI